MTIGAAMPIARGARGAGGSCVHLKSLPFDVTTGSFEWPPPPSFQPYIIVDHPHIETLLTVIRPGGVCIMHAYYIGWPTAPPNL